MFCAADGAGAGADGRGPAVPLFILKLELPVVCFMQNGMVRRRTDEVFVGRVGFAEYDRGKFFVLSSIFNFLGKLGAARCLFPASPRFVVKWMNSLSLAPQLPHFPRNRRARGLLLNFACSGSAKLIAMPPQNPQIPQVFEY